VNAVALIQRQPTVFCNSQPRGCQPGSVPGRSEPPIAPLSRANDLPKRPFPQERTKIHCGEAALQCEPQHGRRMFRKAPLRRSERRSTAAKRARGPKKHLRTHPRKPLVRRFRPASRGENPHAHLREPLMHTSRTERVTSSWRYCAGFLSLPINLRPRCSEVRMARLSTPGLYKKD